jgi:hypothetical protein
MLLLVVEVPVKMKNRVGGVGMGVEDDWGDCGYGV